MSASMPNAARSQEVGTIDSVRRVPAKAALREQSTVGSSRSGRKDTEFRLGPTLYDVLVDGHGSVKALVLSVNEHKDPTLLKRQISSGTLELRELFKADPTALVVLGEWLIETFGGKRKSKRQMARERLPELLTLMLDVLSEEM